MGGRTSDTGITNSHALPSLMLPIIVSYDGTTSDYSWGIYIKTSSSDFVISISISSTGFSVLA